MKKPDVETAQLEAAANESAREPAARMMNPIRAYTKEEKDRRLKAEADALHVVDTRVEALALSDDMPEDK